MITAAVAPAVEAGKRIVSLPCHLLLALTGHERAWVGGDANDSFTFKFETGFANTGYLVFLTRV